jgi:hypothetical protein
MPLGELADQGLGHAFDLKITPALALEPITHPMQGPGQFVIIDVLSELSGHKHLAGLERLPPSLNRIMGCVENDAVRVEVRIKCPGCLMPKRGTDQLTGHSVGGLTTFAHPGRRQRLQLIQGDANCIIMGANQPRVAANQGRNG